MEHPRQREPVIEDYKRQGPQNARDRVLERMLDSRFHSAHELEFLPDLRPGEWVGAVRDLIEIDYVFARRSMSLIMRRRDFGEDRPVLSVLLAGIDATVDEDMNVRIASREVPTLVSQPRAPTFDELGSEDGEQNDERGDFVEEEGGPSSSGRTFDVEEGGSDDPALSDRMNIAPDLMLSVSEAVTMTIGVLAKKGSGKTYLAMVMAEEFLAASMPFVVLDPTGVWWGLRADTTGGAAPWAPLVLGGEHGDVPLGPDNGAAVAKLLVLNWPKPVIVDTSLMTPDEQHGFAADFGIELYAKNERKPRHIFIDEADELMPQYPDTSTYKHQKRALATYDRIVRRGRTRGLGITLITQRSAVINKNVLSQVDGLFVLNMVAPADVSAVEAWMERWVDPSDRRACLRELPKLGRGDAFFIQGGVKHKFRRIYVRQKITWDSSRTPSMNDLKPAVPMALSLAVDEDVTLAREMLGQKSFLSGDFDLGEEGGEEGGEGFHEGGGEGGESE